MDIVLDLKKHCVETEIKRVHQRAVMACFRGGADQAQLETIIDLSQQALEQLDFGFLRGHYPALAGGCDATVSLCRSAAGPQIVLNGRPLRDADGASPTRSGS